MTRIAEKTSLIWKDESYAIIGACFAVYKDKGRRFLEIKAVSTLIDEHRAQLLNYLNATGCNLGLLVNFGHYPGLEYERLVTREQEVDDVYL
jgi:hypothetical protein